MAEWQNIAGLTGASVNIVVGVLGIIRPQQMSVVLALEPLSVRGVTEIRVTFGALWLAIGLALIMRPSPDAFALAGVAWLALAASRLVFAVTADHLDRTTFSILALEVATAAFLLVAARP
jgi:hypothetical protein